MTARQLMTMAVTLGVLLGALFLAGCSLAEKAVQNERVAEAVIQNRTLAFINGAPERAERVERVASKALELLEKDRQGRLKELRSMAEEAIPWGRLSELESKSLRALLVVIEQGLDEHAGDSKRLTDQQELYLSSALAWVIESAEMVP